MTGRFVLDTKVYLFKKIGLTGAFHLPTHAYTISSLEGPRAIQKNSRYSSIISAHIYFL